jgi:hypothetical protein
MLDSQDKYIYPQISELPKTPSLNNPGYLFVLRHPSSWYSAVVGRGTHSSLSSDIFTSIERTLKNHDNKAMLHVILWANVFNISKGEEEFWKDAEEAALRRLPIKMLWYWLLVPGDQLGVELDHDWRRSEIS